MQKYLSVLLCCISLLAQAELSPKVKKLFEAAQNGDTAFLQKARDNGEDLSVQDEKGNTLVHAAAFNDHKEAIDVLTKPYKWGWWDWGTLGIKPFFGWFFSSYLPSLETQNNEGDTPLHFAAEKGHKEVVDYLLARNVNVLIKNKKNIAAIFVAIKMGRIDLLHSFLNMDQSSIESILKLRLDGKNLLTQVIEHKQQQLIERLLKYPTLVKELDDHGKAPIHYAAALQDKDALALLLQHGVDPNQQDKRGNTPLCYAYANNFKEGIAVLKKYNADVNVKDNYGETLLHKAVNNKNVEALQDLLASKADINIQDRQGRTPLHCAILYNHDVIDLILSDCPNMSLKTQDGLTPFMLAADRGLLTIVQKFAPLSNIDSVDNGGNTALMRAIARKDNGTCAYLRNMRADITKTNNKGNNVIHIAVLHENVEMLRSLLGDIKAVLMMNKINGDGETPLHIAALLSKQDYVEKDRDTHLECAKLLLKNGATIGIVNKEGLTPLHYSAIKGHKTFIQTLIAHDNTCVTSLTKKKDSALSLAIKNKRFNCIAELKHPLVINQKNEDKDTPLMLGVIAGLNRNGLENLIRSGANVEEKDFDKNNCVHLSIAHNNQDAFDLFITYSRLLDERNGTRKAPIHQVLDKKDIQKLKQLLQAGCDVNIEDDYGKTPLTYAAEMDDKKMLNYLIAYRANLNKKDIYGFSPLAHAVKVGSLDCIKRLCEAGALKEGTSDGNTLLHIAARYGQVNVIPYLESIGFSRDKRNNNYHTPLMVAAAYGQKEAIDKLIRDSDFSNGDVEKAAKLAYNKHFGLGLILEAQIKQRKDSCTALDNQQTAVHNLKEQNKIHNGGLKQQAIGDYAKFAYYYTPAVWAKKYSFEEIWKMNDQQRSELKTRLDNIQIAERQQNEMLTAKLNGIKQQQEAEVKYARECEHAINLQDIVFKSIQENEQRSKQLEKEMAQLKDQTLPFDHYRYVSSECAHANYSRDAIFRMNEHERNNFIRKFSQCQSYESQEKSKLEYRLNITRNYIKNQNNKQVYTYAAPTTTTTISMPQANNQASQTPPQAPKPTGLAQLRVYGAQEECCICNQQNGESDENGRGTIVIHRFPCPNCKRTDYRICQFCVQTSKGKCPRGCGGPINDFAPYVEVKA